MLARGGNVRVIGGSKRGFKLVCPSGRRVRPTADRIREAIFNILSSCVVEASVLDLMAGTGALGIEALSRGAQKAVFVDNHIQSITLIRQNLAHCGLAHLGTVIKKDALVFLREDAVNLAEPFDLVFVDPPYAWGETAKLLHLIGPSVLSPTGLVLVEHAADADLPTNVGQLAQIDCRRYGNTELVFYQPGLQ